MSNDAGAQSPQNLILAAIERIHEENSLAALITLVEASGDVGAKLLVEETGAQIGSLNGAALDSIANAHVSTFLTSKSEAATFKVEELTRQLEQPQLEHRQLKDQNLVQWLEARLLYERIEPEPRLVICGAGHVGASLARLARFVGYRVTLIDDRAEFVTRERFPDGEITLVVAANWTDAVRENVGRGRGINVAVVTRGHNEDEECLRAVVNAQPDYVGLIGSRRRTNIVLDRLRDAGANEAQLQSVRAPIGLDIGAVTPEEVALAILAEIVSERRGGTGASLSSWRREN
jgi:xanthine dehydrogenase accessory factor